LKTVDYDCRSKKSDRGKKREERRRKRYSYLAKGVRSFDLPTFSPTPFDIGMLHFSDLGLTLFLREVSIGCIMNTTLSYLCQAEFRRKAFELVLISKSFAKDKIHDRVHVPG
jgi:hypothetical protein